MRKNLKDARQKLNLTQREMAQILNTSLRNYQHIEQGARDGNFLLWDTLEDMTHIHQRVLQEDSKSVQKVE